eukprot:Tamp_19988.p1 GENE.Tamp_19988~~Tamp_19988.p1  ORF type:complete len:286 (+),score=65.23 Tamp_19988:128-859(+)
MPEAVLIPEYGVIHLKGCLSERGQRELWEIIKPRVTDPAGKATGFSGFSVSRKARAGRAERRDQAIDAFGALLFRCCGEALLQLTTEEECAEEPSYVRLRALVDGSKGLKLDEIFGNYYRPEAKLLNHTDGDNVLFSMTMALGDDCEFVIGEPTNRHPVRLSERNGKARTIVMKSGDAVFFDGGSVAHQVTRMLHGTAPAWWEGAKVPNGSRCVIVFREKEESFYNNKIQRERKQAGKQAGKQ